MDKNLIRTSKYISKLLRHDNEDLEMDKNGWVIVKDLCTKVGINRTKLEEIVETDNKNRFAYSSDKNKIRANQGHSLSVDVELKETQPPKSLYHGTSSKVIDIIMQEGMKPMSRQYIHLSLDEDTAINVGNRHTKSVSATTVLLAIDSEKMFSDGYKFYLSENGVWLTSIIPTEYINIIKYCYDIKHNNLNIY